MSEETTKAATIDDQEDDLRPQYDLSRLLEGGVRGKYVERYWAGTNLVLLEPDVARVFATAETVNEALRLVMQISRLHLSADVTSSSGKK